MSEEQKNAAGTPGEGAGAQGEARTPEALLSEQELQSLLKKAGSKGETEGQSKPAPMELADVGAGASTQAAGSIDMLMDVTLNVRIELGRTRLSVEDILNMQGGSVVTLDRLAGDFVDVLVNDKLVARGEVLVLNDHFCVRIAEIVSPEERENASLA